MPPPKGSYPHKGTSRIAELLHHLSPGTFGARLLVTGRPRATSEQETAFSVIHSQVSLSGITSTQQNSAAESTHYRSTKDSDVFVDDGFHPQYSEGDVVCRMEDASACTPATSHSVGQQQSLGVVEDEDDDVIFCHAEDWDVQITLTGSQRTEVGTFDPVLHRLPSAQLCRGQCAQNTNKPASAELSNSSLLSASVGCEPETDMEVASTESTSKQDRLAENANLSTPAAATSTGAEYPHVLAVSNPSHVAEDSLQSVSDGHDSGNAGIRYVRTEMSEDVHSLISSTQRQQGKKTSSTMASKCKNVFTSPDSVQPLFLSPENGNGNFRNVKTELTRDTHSLISLAERQQGKNTSSTMSTCKNVPTTPQACDNEVSTTFQLVETHSLHVNSNTRLVSPTSSVRKSFQQLSTEGFFRCGNKERMCTYRTQTPTEFDAHLRLSHADEVFFPCVHCGSAEMSCDSLLQHLEEHLALQRLLLYCIESTCDFNSYSPEEVLMHLSVAHTSVTGLACWRCSTSFSSLQSFASHVKQNLIQVVRCPLCSAKDTDRQRIMAHISSSHPGRGRMVSLHKLLLCQERALSAWHAQNTEHARQQKCPDTEPTRITSLCDSVPQKHVASEHWSLVQSSLKLNDSIVISDDEIISDLVENADSSVQMSDGKTRVPVLWTTEKVGLSDTNSSNQRSANPFRTRDPSGPWPTGTFRAKRRTCASPSTCILPTMQTRFNGEGHGAEGVRLLGSSGGVASLESGCSAGQTHLALEVSVGHGPQGPPRPKELSSSCRSADGFGHVIRTAHSAASDVLQSSWHNTREQQRTEDDSHACLETIEVSLVDNKDSTWFQKTYAKSLLARKVPLWFKKTLNLKLLKSDCDDAFEVVCSLCAHGSQSTEHHLQHLATNHKEHFQGFACLPCKYFSLNCFDGGAHECLARQSSETDEHGCVDEGPHSSSSEYTAAQSDSAESAGKQRGQDTQSRMEEEHVQTEELTLLCAQGPPRNCAEGAVRIGGLNVGEAGNADSSALEPARKKRKSKKKDSEGLHWCTLCGYSVFTKRNIMNHMYKQHQEIMRCPLCWLLPKNHKEMYSHLLSCHPELKYLYKQLCVTNYITCPSGVSTKSSGSDNGQKTRSTQKTSQEESHIIPEHDRTSPEESVQDDDLFISDEEVIILDTSPHSLQEGIVANCTTKMTEQPPHISYSMNRSMECFTQETSKESHRVILSSMESSTQGTSEHPLQEASARPQRKESSHSMESADSMEPKESFSDNSAVPCSAAGSSKDPREQSSCLPLNIRIGKPFLLLTESTVQKPTSVFVKEHSKRLSDKGFFCCSNGGGTCEFSTQYLAQFERHLHSQHPGETCYPCVYCGQKETSWFALCQHFVGHFANRYQLLCSSPSCEHKFCLAEDLLRHIASYHPDMGTVTCLQCGANSATLEEFSLHLSQNLVQLFQCPLCPALDTDKQRVVAHFLKTHPNSDILTSGVTFCISLCWGRKHSR